MQDLPASLPTPGATRPRRRPRRPTSGWLPAAPLIERIERAGGLRGCGILRGNGGGREAERLAKVFARARARGTIRIHPADELCIRALGVHPVSVWGDLWWSELVEADAVRADNIERTA